MIAEAVHPAVGPDPDGAATVLEHRGHVGGREPVSGAIAPDGSGAEVHEAAVENADEAEDVAADVAAEEPDEAEAEETQSKMDKLMEIGTKVRTFYDMHKNYKKYDIPPPDWQAVAEYAKRST